MGAKKEAASEALAVASDMMADGTVTVAGLKEEFGIGRSVAYELMTAGLLPFTQINKRRLIPRRGVKKLLAERLVGVVK